jgi:hypothetical protein
MRAILAVKKDEELNLEENWDDDRTWINQSLHFPRTISTWLVERALEGEQKPTLTFDEH